MPRLLAVLLALLGLAALMTPLAAGPSRKVPAAHETRLQLAFPHERHDRQTCLSCHHKVEGMTQTIPCIACHRLPDPAIKLSAEPRFHAFCRGCHEENSRAGLPHGPVRGCMDCHGQS
jgi:hypothetical protein